MEYMKKNIRKWSHRKNNENVFILKLPQGSQSQNLQILREPFSVLQNRF